MRPWLENRVVQWCPVTLPSRATHQTRTCPHPVCACHPMPHAIQAILTQRLGTVDNMIPPLTLSFFWHMVTNQQSTAGSKARQLSHAVGCLGKKHLKACCILAQCEQGLCDSCRNMHGFHMSQQDRQSKQLGIINTNDQCWLKVQVASTWNLLLNRNATWVPRWDTISLIVGQLFNGTEHHATFCSFFEPPCLWHIYNGKVCKIANEKSHVPQANCK